MRVLVLITASALCVFSVGCGSDFSSSAARSSSLSVGGNSDAGIAAFQNTLYSFAKAQNCVSCHGAGTSPLFASSDLQTAYAAAKGLVDFTNPGSSPFIAYSANGHCGPNNPICANSNSPATVQADLTTWAAAELSAGTPTNDIPSGPAAQYVTESVAIPANLPSLTGTPAVMRFPLSSLNIPVAGFAEAILEIQIQQPSAGEYRVNNLKIVGVLGALTITGVHVYVKSSTAVGVGNEDMNQGNVWDSLVVPVPISSLPDPIPATTFNSPPLITTALQIQSVSSTDMLTIGFDNLQ